MYTSDDVIRAFSSVNGELLRVEPFPSELEGIVPRVEFLSLKFDSADTRDSVAEDPQDKYGEFDIAVYRERLPREFRRAAADQKLRWTELPDETGRWGGGTHLLAEKFYGPNVQLRWWPKHKEPVTNEQWDRLDRALRELTLT